MDADAVLRAANPSGSTGSGGGAGSGRHAVSPTPRTANRASATTTRFMCPIVVAFGPEVELVCE